MVRGEDQSIRGDRIQRELRTLRKVVASITHALAPTIRTVAEDLASTLSAHAVENAVGELPWWQSKEFPYWEAYKARSIPWMDPERFERRHKAELGEQALDIYQQINL